MQEKPFGWSRPPLPLTLEVAEFGGDDGHGLDQHPSVLEVGEEGGGGAVEFVGEGVELSRAAMHGVPIAP